MPAVDESTIKISGLSGGISHQPAHVRHPTQVEDATNAVFSVVDGVSKRPGAEYLCVLADMATASRLRMHGIKRDDTEKYLVVFGIEDGESDLGIRVFDLDGSEATVNITGAAQTYLNLNSATADDIRMVTVADHTIITNTTVEVGTLASGSRTDYDITQVHSNYDVMTSWNPTSDTYHSTEADSVGHPSGFFQYTLAENGFAEWEGPEVGSSYSDITGRYDEKSRNPMGFKVEFTDNDDAGNNTHEYNVVEDFYEDAPTSMDDVALRFQRKLQAAGARNALIKWESSGAENGRFTIISPYRGTGASISNISAPDGAHDLTYNSSPKRPFEWGDSDETLTAGTGTPADVVDQVDILDRWERVPPPDQANAELDPATMPVKMVRTTVSPLVFDVSAITWGFRPNGDDDTNPVPSIWDNGSKITDVIFHRNRMALAGDENKVFSRAGDFFEFYIEDHDSIADSDPIDIAISSDRVTLIDFLVPFRETVVTFTKAGRQFEMNAPDNLTPTSAAITPTTAYLTMPDIRPQAMGSMIYFAATRKDAAILYEYFYDDTRVSNFAADVTAHAFNLLPTTLRTIQTSPNNNMVLVLPEDSDTIYVYTSFWSGNEKAQSAWTRYEFDDSYDIEDIAVIDNDCYMLVDAGAEGFIIESFALARQTADDDGFAYVVHLDRQFELTGSYAGGVTTWTLSDSVEDETLDTLVLGPDFGSESGDVKSPTVSGGTVTLAGDWTDGEVIVGRGYTMSVELSEQYVRDYQGLARQTGWLQVRRVDTHHHNSLAYSIRANMRARSNDREKSLDASTIEESGTLTAWFGGNSKDLKLFIENDTPKPSTITAVELLVQHADRRG